MNHLGLRTIRTSVSLRAQHASRMTTLMIGTMESKRAISYTRVHGQLMAILAGPKTSEGKGKYWQNLYSKVSRGH